MTDMRIDMLAREEADSYTRKIPPDEVSFHPHSFADSDGRLFWWRGQLYRGISAEKAPFFDRLLREGVIESLIERGLLIETQPTPYALDGYPMVVRHSAVPFVSYPDEWCPAMLKEAGLTILDLASDLIGRGLTLKDGHPWNLLFDSLRPVYVDLTSIIASRDERTWIAYDEFCRFCFYPLILMSYGQDRIARSLLPEYEGVRRSEVIAMARSYAPSAFLLTKLVERCLKPVRGLRREDGRQAQSRLIKQMARQIERLSLPSSAARSSEEADAARQAAVQSIIERLRPGSVLDIASGAGSYSKLAALHAERVVSFDADPEQVTRLYCDAREARLPILPLVMDFFKPAPSVGFSSHYSMAATDRFRCDMVLAMGLIHRLVFERYLSFDLLAEGLSLFSRRWLVAEFAPREKEAGGFTWYTLDNLLDALKKRFRSIELMRPDGGRSALLVCEK